MNLFKLLPMAPPPPHLRTDTNNKDWFFSYAAFDNLGEIMFSKQFGFIETGTDVGSSIKDITGLQVYIVSTAFYPWM